MNQDYSKLSQTIGLMNCKEEEPNTPQGINEIDTENENSFMKIAQNRSYQSLQDDEEEPQQNSF